MWKQSTQNFGLHLFSGTAKRRRNVLSGKWRPKPGAHFTIQERGKTRQIDAPHINDRQIHKVLTKEVLEPLYQPGMIYENGASQKGKGLSFHYKRLKKSLRAYYRKHGREGCIDLVALPSAVDNWLACQLRAIDPGHYMDDYKFLARTKEEAEANMAAVTERMEAMGLKVNRKKSKIVPLSRPFRFCKAKFYLTETGRIITHGCRDGMKRARRKLRYFRAQVDAGTKTAAEVERWLNDGPIAYYKQFNDHGRVLHLRRLYYALFIKGRTEEEKQCIGS